MYSPLDIANWFIQKGISERRPVDPLKLQKLIYLAHGWSLGILNESLISEGVQAWRHGPVIPSVYYAFREYGAQKILSVYQERDDLSVGALSKDQDEDTKQILDFVWRRYSEYSGIGLRDLTHEKDTPWDQTYHTYGSNSIIDDEIIKTHYTRLAKELLYDVGTQSS